MADKKNPPAEEEVEDTHAPTPQEESEADEGYIDDQGVPEEDYADDGMEDEYVDDGLGEEEYLDDGMDDGLDNGMGMNDPFAEGMPQEPMSASVIRRVYEDFSILMRDYDEMTFLLEQPKVKTWMVKLLMNNENILTQCEQLFDALHPELPPLSEDQMDVGGDGTEGNPYAEEMDLGGEEYYDEEPLDEEYDEEGVDDESQGGDDVDGIGGEGEGNSAPADKGEESTEEEAAAAMSKKRGKSFEADGVKAHLQKKGRRLAAIVKKGRKLPPGTPHHVIEELAMERDNAKLDYRDAKRDSDERREARSHDPEMANLGVHDEKRRHRYRVGDSDSFIGRAKPTRERREKALDHDREDTSKNIFAEALQGPEVSHVQGAHKHLDGLKDLLTSAHNESHRQESYHHYKCLESIAGCGEDKDKNAKGLESLHPHRSILKNSVIPHLRELSQTKDYGAPHKRKSEVMAGVLAAILQEIENSAKEKDDDEDDKGKAKSGEVNMDDDLDKETKDEVEDSEEKGVKKRIRAMRAHAVDIERHGMGENPANRMLHALDAKEALTDKMKDSRKRGGDENNLGAKQTSHLLARSHATDPKTGKLYSTRKERARVAHESKDPNLFPDGPGRRALDSKAFLKKPSKGAENREVNRLPEAEGSHSEKREKRNDEFHAKRGANLSPIPSLARPTQSLKSREENESFLARKREEAAKRQSPPTDTKALALIEENDRQMKSIQEINSRMEKLLKCL